MQELELLSLVNAQITDAALEQLPPLKGLRRLLIYNTKVSAEAAEALRKRRPELMIPWSYTRRR